MRLLALLEAWNPGRYKLLTMANMKAIKDAIASVVLSPEFQSSLPGLMLRNFVRATHSIYGYSPEFRLHTQALERPNYGYCMINAARLAKALGYDAISALEFGVAGGNGLAFMADFASEVEKLVGVRVDCYGFDSGVGMPDPEEARDLPYWFRAAQYKMDQDKLKARVPNAKLVLGPVHDTIKTFVETYKPAPIGCLFLDMDYYSSTRDSLQLFARSAELHQHFLPRIFTYLDDVLGSEIEMYGEFNGQLAAITEFNKANLDKKIHLNQNLIHQRHLKYAHQIYYVHLMSHPQYEAYIGGDAQENIEEILRLRVAA